jgi:hypothetical protein
MNDLILLNSHAFKLTSDINSSILLRAYDARLNRNDHIILRFTKSAEVIDLGTLSNITINGLATNFEAIRKLVFNSLCVCLGDEEPEQYKIFDFTFNNTFE